MLNRLQIIHIKDDLSITCTLSIIMKDFLFHSTDELQNTTNQNLYLVKTA